MTSEVTKRIRLIERVCLVEKFLQLGEYLLEMKNFSRYLFIYLGERREEKREERREKREERREKREEKRK